jgi:hypothetical protein
MFNNPTQVATAIMDCVKKFQLDVRVYVMPQKITAKNCALNLSLCGPTKTLCFCPFSFKLLSSPSLTLTHCGGKISSLSRFTLKLVLSIWSSLLSRQHLSFYNCGVFIVSSRHGADTVAH